jgi:hypothetical protein
MPDKSEPAAGQRGHARAKLEAGIGRARSRTPAEGGSDELAAEVRRFCVALEETLKRLECLIATIAFNGYHGPLERQDYVSHQYKKYLEEDQ